LAGTIFPAESLRGRKKSNFVGKRCENKKSVQREGTKKSGHSTYEKKDSRGRVRGSEEDNETTIKQKGKKKLKFSKKNEGKMGREKKRTQIM